MPFYFYARVRTYISTSDTELSDDDIKNNRVFSDPIICSDASADGTSKKQYVWYVFDIHKSTIPSFDVWKASPQDARGDLVPGNNSKQVLIQIPGSDTVYKNSDDVATYTDRSSISNFNSHYGHIIGNKGGKPRSILFGTFFVYHYDSEPRVQNPVTNIFWDNTAKKPPTIKFTQVGGKPAAPNNIQTWLETAAPKGPSVGATVAAAKAYAKANLTISNGGEWSTCRKKWYYMVVDSKEKTATLWESDEKGKTYTMTLGKKPSFSDQAAKDKWTKINGAELIKAMDPKNCDGSEEKVPPTIGSDFNVEVVPPKDAGRWNPPPHSESRSIPYSIRTAMNNSISPEKATFTGLQNSANFYSKSGQYLEELKGYKYLERGRIFQDALSASVLNQTNTGGKPPGPNESNQWGFRFMYNPTSFSYSTQANNSIDWTMGSKDTAALLAGNQTVQLQLYLNRIVDLNYLNVLYGNSSGKIGMNVYNQLSPIAAYGRELAPVEIEGILNRGTEYDLEFLYRCLTGDPQTNNPLLNDKLRKTGSADIGYITGIPLWLYLNDNLRYFGAVSGFEVNHLIFNTEMVPTLSVVTLSFGRYPAQFANDATTLQAVRDNFFPPAST